uniref:Venom polypeptide n=1 Tax=Dolopus genitalis TaxID=2488630 RepID=A0A3G5BIE6_DOLGE|nr:venom polypeptide [Dolopus genitalis]
MARLLNILLLIVLICFAFPANATHRCVRGGEYCNERIRLDCCFGDCVKNRCTDDL